MLRYLYCIFRVKQLKRKKRRCVPYSLYHKLNYKYMAKFTEYVLSMRMYLGTHTDIIDGFNWEGD